MANLTPQAKPGLEQSTPLGAKPSASQSISNGIKKLSLREKVLIWALIFVAVVLAMIFLLILPAIDNLTASQATRDALRAEENSARMTIATMPTSQESLENAQVRYAEYLLKYQAPMLPEDIDRMLTTVVEDCGFTPVTLTLNPYDIEGVPSFLPLATAWELPHPEVTEETVDSSTGLDAAVTGETAEDGSTETTADGTSDVDASTTETDTAVSEEQNTATIDAATDALNGPQAQVFNVQMTVMGYEESFYAFLDRIVPLSWIKVSTTSFNPATSYSYSEEQIFTISMKIYVNAEATVKQP